MKQHFQDPRTMVFPLEPFEEIRGVYYPKNVAIEAHQWISLLRVGESLGKQGKQFTQWALEELTAWGKASYREKDNSFVPILTDGTSIEGYVSRNSNRYGPKGAVAKPRFADLSFFWAYAVAYRTTGDTFMWEMIHDIALGNSFGDIGRHPDDPPELERDTTCSDVYGLLAFLELYEKTSNPSFLQMARRIGGNIVGNQFHEGLFVLSKEHIYSRFDLFASPYRHKQEAVDRWAIYALTDSPELPLSLQEAASIGDVELVRSLLDEGVGVDSWDDSLKRTVLQHAAIRGHKHVVELLLTRGARIDAKEDWPGGTALHYAAEHGHSEVAELLIAKGGDVNTKRGYPAGDTPLHSAARAGHKDIVELLIDKGADVRTTNNRGRTAIDMAMREGHKQIGEFLQAKATETSIHEAARQGLLDKVKSFLENGIAVNAKDESGVTPLLLAVSNGHADVARFLIDNGADVNAGDKRGYVPLVYAMWNMGPNVVKLLLDKGADVNARHAQTGYTPLHWAVMMDNVESMKLVLAAGAKVNAGSKAGETPLDVAAHGVSAAIGELLVAKGAKISSLHAAAYVGDLTKVKAFINDGVDVNTTKGMLKGTALHSAAAGGRIEVVEFLIRKGSDLDAQNGPGQTPSHMAAGGGHLDVLQLLLKSGADINTKDRNGRTPLHLAQRAEHIEIVDLLHKQMQIHDVAVAKVSTVPSCTQGETVSIAVKLDNRGDFRESSEIKLMDSTTGSKIADRSVQLPSKHHSASEADLTLIGENVGDYFGDRQWVEGDLDGDGVNDILISASNWNKATGRVYLYYGGTNISGTPDLVFQGEGTDDRFGNWGPFTADMNGDNTDDLMVCARTYDDRGRAYIFYGGANMDNVADVIIDPPRADGTGLSYGAPCPGDFNGDDIMDLVIGAADYGNSTGRLYLYYGPVRSGAKPDKTFTGEGELNRLGRELDAGDVDGDGCDDLLVSNRYYPDRTAITSGRAYLFWGGKGQSMDTTVDITFEAEGPKDQLGNSGDILDIDGDGYADMVIGAALYPGAPTDAGRVYLYWGKPRGSLTNVPDLIFDAPDGTNSHFGTGLILEYADDDSYADILVTAYGYDNEDYRGRCYIFYGGPQGDMDTIPDHVFTGDTVKFFGWRNSLGDVNGDSYGDVLWGGYGYDDYRGRALLWYGPFHATNDITFNWDTTNASIGKHTLKVEIPPVPGEQNTENNTRTVTVEVKEPSK